MFQRLCFPFLSFGEADAEDYVIIRFGITWLIFFFSASVLLGFGFFLPLQCNVVFVFTVSTLLCSCLKEKESRHVPWLSFCETFVEPLCVSTLAYLCLLAFSSSSIHFGWMWTSPVSRTVLVLGLSGQFGLTKNNGCGGKCLSEILTTATTTTPEQLVSTRSSFDAGDAKNLWHFPIIHSSWDDLGATTAR